MLPILLFYLLNLLLEFIFLFRQFAIRFLFDFYLFLLHLKDFVLNFLKLEIALLFIPNELSAMLVIKSLELLDLAE